MRSHTKAIIRHHFSSITLVIALAVIAGCASYWHFSYVIYQKRFHAALFQAHEHVVKTQQERSREAFEKSGQAIDMKINPMKSGRRNAKLTELSVTQELRPGERRTGDEVEFAMTIAPDGFRDAANPA